MNRAITLIAFLLVAISACRSAQPMPPSNSTNPPRPTVLTSSTTGMEARRTIPSNPGSITPSTTFTPREPSTTPQPTSNQPSSTKPHPTVETALPQTSNAQTSTIPSPAGTQPVVTTNEVVPLGHIYIWDGATFYGNFIPQIDSPVVDGSNLVPLFPTDPKMESPGGNSDALAFAYYSDQVAYATFNHIHVRLWIDDIRLNDGNLIWTDSEDWLHYDSGYDTLQLKWLFRDKFLLIANRSTLVLYNILHHEAYRLSGICGWLGISSRTEYLAVWCPLPSSQEEYLVLEKDGSVWRTNELSLINIAVQDWAFAPEEEKVLYARPNGELGIVDASLNSTTLPFSYFQPTVDIPQRVLQWSQDGSRLFIHAEDNANQACQNFAHLCWLILDSRTGSVIWHPDQELSGSGFDAALSPDGNWVAIFVLNVPDRRGYVVSVESSMKYKIADWLPAAIYWSK